MSVSIIHPTDFARYEPKATKRLGAWNEGTLARLAAYLIKHDVEVIVEVEARTGHAIRGKVTAWKWSTIHSNYPHLQIRDEYGNLTNYRADGIGQIIVIGVTGHQARWELSMALGEETVMALRAVRKDLGQDYPDEDPAKGPRSFTVLIRRDFVEVIWGEDTFRARRWFVQHERIIHRESH